MSDNDPVYQSTRKRIAIGTFQFMLGTSAALLLYGMFFPGGVERLIAMKEIIYTIGATYSVIVTGYMGVDAISRLRGRKDKTDKEGGEE